MNTDKAEGKLDQITGKIKQSVGEAVGNDRLANSGVADQVKGAAKETWGNAKDTAHEIHDNTRETARSVDSDNLHDRSEDSAHNLREKVVAGAERTRDSINQKLDDVKRDHNRS